MALPKTKKRIIPDISDAVKRAAGSTGDGRRTEPTGADRSAAKGGRPSPRDGNVVRQTLLLSEATAERLTMAYAGEQIKRRKTGNKLDKSLFIEEMIIAWLDRNEV